MGNHPGPGDMGIVSFSLLPPRLTSFFKSKVASHPVTFIDNNDPPNPPLSRIITPLHLLTTTIPLNLHPYPFRLLRPFPTDATGQLDVLWHDGHALGMDGTQKGVLEQPHQVVLR